MADVQANIVLTTTGGSESAAEVMKADNAVRNLTSASSGLEGQFQHRFQHIGLMLFAGDALRASGLGRETRMVVSALNLVLTEGATAAGLSSGGIMLVVTAMIALAGIAVKVIGHHKDEAEALEKVADAAVKHAQETSKEVDAIQAYIDAGGVLTKGEQQEFEAKKDLAEATQKLADIELTQAVPAINQHIIALQEQRAHLIAQSATVNALAETWLAKYIPPFRIAAEIAKAFTSSGADLTKRLGEIDVALEQQIVKLKEYQVAIVDIRHGNAINWEEKKKQIDEEKKAEEDMLKAISDGEHVQYEDVVKLHKAIAEDHKKQAEKRLEQEKQWAEGAKQAFDSVESHFGSAVAKMLVEGKSFAEEMNNAFRMMEEQIIEMIVKMIAEWMLFEAITGMGGGGFAAQMFPKFAGGFASGGSVTADTPTLAMFGESGPETATFTPLGSNPGQGGGGGNVTNIHIDVTANGVSDPNELARMVGPALIQEIRGAGQLNFTRA